MHSKYLSPKRLHAIVTSYAADIESVWEGTPRPTPSLNRQPLVSAAEMGLDITEFEYAAAARFALEDMGAELGFTGARETVLFSRTLLSTARDAGTEPYDFATDLLCLED